MDISLDETKHTQDEWNGIGQLLLMFIAVSLGVAVLFWLYLNVQASMQVNASNAQIRLPTIMNADIEIGNALQAQAIGQVDTTIAVRQNINLPLEGKYLTDLKFRVTTPVTVDLDYTTNVRIETLMPIETTTDLVYQSKLLPEFPLKLDVPVKLDVPFHIKRRYQLPVEIEFDGPVYLAFNEQLTLPVNHIFKPHLVLNDAIEMSNISGFSAEMENLSPQTQADLNMKIDVPFTAIQPSSE